jgi:hypothetical protein
MRGSPREHQALLFTSVFAIATLNRMEPPSLLLFNAIGGPVRLPSAAPLLQPRHIIVWQGAVRLAAVCLVLGTVFFMLSAAHLMLLGAVLLMLSAALPVLAAVFLSIAAAFLVCYDDTAFLLKAMLQQ